MALLIACMWSHVICLSSVQLSKHPILSLPSCPLGDAGDYDIWFSKVNQVLAKYSNFYGASGCHLSLQHVHGSCWIQIDVNPMAVAVGSPGEKGRRWTHMVFFIYIFILEYLFQSALLFRSGYACSLSRKVLAEYIQGPHLLDNLEIVSA